MPEMKSAGTDWGQLFRESTITQAFLAVVWVLASAFVVVRNSTIPGAVIVLPEWWLLAGGTIMGFYFRAKTDVSAQTAARQTTENIQAQFLALLDYAARSIPAGAVPGNTTTVTTTVTEPQAATGAAD